MKRLSAIIGNHPVLALVFTTVFSVFLSFLSVEFFRRFPSRVSLKLGLVLFAIFSIAGLLVPLIAVGFAIFSSFQKRSRAQMFKVIFVAYLGSILIFAGEYYVIVGVDDYNDARMQINHYEAEATSVGAHLSEKVKPYKSQKAFTGFESHLWSTFEDDHYDAVALYTNYPQGLKPAVENAKNNLRFLPENRLLVFANCLHYSVITMTTVGFGDISPQVWLARFYTDIEALTGTALFIVALGMVFGNWWEPSIPQKP